MSRLTRERGGFDLMPESGYQPTSKYLPPRERKMTPEVARLEPEAPIEGMSPLLRWVDRVLSR